MTLELRGISLLRNEARVLDGISLTLTAGSIAVITGQTGAGKSSLLRVIAGLTQPTSGTIAFDGQRWDAPACPVPTESRGLGMVFQDLVLWPHLRVAEQIEITLQPMARTARRERTSQVLQALEIADVANRYPSEISGGQQQRVAIGRALARRPRLALLDEPTNQLDKSTAERVSQWLRSEQSTGGGILIVVTHDMETGGILSHDALGEKSWKLVNGNLQAITARS